MYVSMCALVQNTHIINIIARLLDLVAFCDNFDTLFSSCIRQWELNQSQQEDYPIAQVDIFLILRYKYWTQSLLNWNVK